MTLYIHIHIYIHACVLEKSVYIYIQSMYSVRVYTHILEEYSIYRERKHSASVFEKSIYILYIYTRTFTYTHTRRHIDILAYMYI